MGVHTLLNDAWTEFLAEKKAATAEKYRVAYRAACEFWAKPWEEVTSRDLYAFAAWLGKTRQRATVRLYVSVIKAFFSWSQRRGLIERSPFAGYQDGVRAPRRNQYGWLSWDAAEAAVEDAWTDTRRGLGQRNGTLFSTILASGARVSEAAELRVSDFDSVTGILSLGSGIRRRRVALPEAVASQVRLYLAQRSASATDFLFPSVTGKGLTAHEIGKVAKDHGFRFGVSQLRDAFAVESLRRGVPFGKVHEMLGNASPASTAKYLPSTPMSPREAIELIVEREPEPALAAAG